MKHLHRLWFFTGLGTAIWLSLPKPAYADPAIGFVWAGYPTVTLGLATAGIGSVAVFAIEAVVIKWIAGVSWKKAFIISIAMNVVSSIAGAFLWYVINTGDCYSLVVMFVIPFVLSFVFAFSRRRNSIIVCIAMVAIFIGGLGVLGINGADRHSTSGLWVIIILQILLGFGIGLVAEYPVLKRHVPSEKVISTIFLANIASYIFILIAAPFFWPNPVYQKYEMLQGDFVRSHDWYYTDAGDSVYNRVRKLSLTTPQILGIYNTPDLIKPVDEKYITRILWRTYARGYRGVKPRHTHEETRLSNALEYIDNIQEGFDLSEDARKRIEWIRLWIEMAPKAYDALSENKMDNLIDDLKLLYADWDAREETIGIKVFMVNDEQVDKLIIIRPMLDPHYTERRDIRLEFENLIALYETNLE